MKFYDCVTWFRCQKSSEDDHLNDQLYGFSQRFKNKDTEEMYQQHRKSNITSLFRISTAIQILINLTYSFGAYHFYGNVKITLLRGAFMLWLCLTLVLEQWLCFKWINKINFFLVFNSYINVSIFAYFFFTIIRVEENNDFMALMSGINQAIFATSYFLICPSWQAQTLIILGYFTPLVYLSGEYLNYKQWQQFLLILFVCIILRVNDRYTKLMFYQIYKQKQNTIACREIFDQCVASSIIIVKTNQMNLIQPPDLNGSLQFEELLPKTFEMQYANKFAQESLNCSSGLNCMNQIQNFSVIRETNQSLSLLDVLKSSLWVYPENVSKSIEYALGIEKQVLTCSRNNNDLQNQSQNDQKEYYDVTLRSCIWEGANSIIIILNDTTDKVTRIEQLNDLNSYKDKLLATVSHDLKTPLNANQLLLFTMREICKNKKALELSDIKYLMQYIHDIYTSNCMLIIMINDLLDYSQIRLGALRLQIDWFSLDDCLEGVFTIFKQQTKSKKLQLIFEKVNFTGTLRLRTDQNRLKQVLINLLSNSLKFTYEGHIKLIVDYQEPCIEFCVMDTGIGMPQTVVEKLFQQYATFNLGNKNQQGVGLGLVISSKLVGLLGPIEKIEVESEEEKGSKFTFRIFKSLVSSDKMVICESESQKVFAQEPETQPLQRLISNASKKTQDQYQVLIVDDTIFNIYAFKLILQRVMKCCVTDAFNGLNAVNSIKSGMKYDLVFMDIQMPVMDGYRATKLIRQYENEHKQKPCIIIIASACTFQEEYQMALDQGADGLIEKPVSMKILTELLKKFSFID